MAFIFFLNMMANGQMYNYTKYNVENGFPQSNVDCIFQDHDGFLWFATQIGIVKFDGFSYEVINSEKGLTHNLVHHITQDKNRNFWISTKGGLSKISNNKIKGFTIKDGLYSDFIISTCPLTDNSILVCTSKGTNLITNDKVLSVDSNLHVIQFIPTYSGDILAITKSNIYKYRDNKFDSFNSPVNINSVINFITESKDSAIWLATENGIYRFKSDQANWYSTHDGLIDNNIDRLLIDSDNNLWYASEQKGFGKLQNKKFINFTAENGMVNTAVLSLFEDNEQNIWIGGRNGALMMNPKIPFVHFDRISPFDDEIIMGMIRDKSNDLWFCSYGLGIFKFNGDEFINFNSKNGTVDNHFFDVEEDQYGNLWFASASNGMIKYNGKTFKKITDLNGIKISHRVLTIFKDSRNNLWFGTNGNGLIKFDGKMFSQFGQSFDANFSNVMAINEDNENNIIIGTVNEGLFIYNGKNFQRIDDNKNIKAGIIRSIVNENGILWFGTATNGIFKLIKENNNYKQYYYSKKNGLLSDNIYVMYLDSKGFLWVGSEKGVDKILLKDHHPLEITNYSKDDGFSAVETNLNGALEDADGNMWFGTINGAIRYDNKKDKKNKVENKLYITDISLFHEPFDKSIYSDSMDRKGLPVNLKLPFDKNHLTFHFIGLCFSNPGKVKYRYRLLGHNDQWSPPSFDKKAVFSNIEPGYYEFQVISANNNGLWNKEPVSIKFEIIPPYWQKLWFKTLIILSILLIIYIFFEIRNRSLKLTKINLEKKVEERTRELNLQKNKLESSNNKIKEGISYAHKIQSAMLPSEELFKLNFSDYFILYLPRDIVSGDFYWAREFVHENDRHFFIAVADCTGHGIPGALVSMLGMALLNEIIRKKEITSTSHVLEELRTEIKRSLNQKGKLEDQTEGIDMAVCDINLNSGILQFAGANNPLYILRNNDLIVLKPTINPVGIFIKELPFENQIIELKENDIIIMFTDGLIDQFNPLGEKFKLKRFREIVQNNSDINLSDRKRMLEDAFLNWKGNASQIDDVLVIALKIKMQSI